MLEIEEAAQGFSAMGSEARLEVVRVLVRAGETGLSVGEIQARLQIPASTLAHHLKFLAAAGLVTQTREGRAIRTRADFDRVRALADFLIRECCAEERLRPAEGA